MTAPPPPAAVGAAHVEDPVPPAAPDAPSGWLPALRYCTVVVVAVRVGLSLLGIVGSALVPTATIAEAPGWPAGTPSSPWHLAFTAWERWDALWYLSIAAQGYRPDDGSAAFFPLYPLLVHGVGVLTGGRWLLAAFMVTHVALLAGLVVLHRLTELELGARAARRVVLYLCLFPTGFFLFAPFTESLFLALVVGCLYAARRSSWMLAGYLGALASCTRSAGVLLAAPLAVEALLQARARPGPLGVRARTAAPGLAAAAAAPLGLLAYMTYWLRFDQDFWRPLNVQEESWNKVPSTPWGTMQAAYEEGTRFLGTYAGGYHTVDLLLVVLMLLTGIWVTLRLRPTYVVYYWLSALMPLMLMWGGRPLMSVPRYYLVLFPFFWALARFADRWRAHDLVVSASAVGMATLGVLFMNWYFVF